MNLTLHDQDVVIRTEGTHLADAVTDTVVAFEADHIDPTTETGWSVVAVGYAPHSTATEAAAPLPRPWTPGPRLHIIRIRTQLVTGRRLTDIP